MIGGYYVFVIEKSEAAPPREYTSLVAGPFATWTEAEAIGPKAIQNVNAVYPKANQLEWNICQFYAHRLVCGTRNIELWIKPTPVTI